MIEPDQIPPEAVLNMRPHICSHNCGPAVVCRVCEKRAEAAIAAALNAWPEVFQNPHGDYFITHRDALILPLPQEARDAER